MTMRNTYILLGIVWLFVIAFIVVKTHLEYRALEKQADEIIAEMAADGKHAEDFWSRMPTCITHLPDSTVYHYKDGSKRTTANNGDIILMKID